MSELLLVIHANGDVTSFDHSYEALRDTFRSKGFDRVHVSDDIDLWVDGEGLLIGEPLNVPISLAVGRALYGPAVIAAADDVGNTVACRDAQFIDIATSLADQWGRVVKSGAHYGQDVLSYAQAEMVPPPIFVELDDDLNPIPGTERPL